MASKYNSLLKHCSFHFSEQRKELIDKLLNKEKLMTTEEVLQTLRKCALSKDIVELCVNHPSIYRYDLEKFVEDNLVYKHDIPHEVIVDAIIRRKSGYGGSRLLFHIMNVNTIYDELYKNIGKQTELSQDTLLALSDIYKSCDWTGALPQEFACIYAHIKYEDYIKNIVLNDEKFLSSLDNNTRERLLSAIASNIHLRDEFRNEVFDMGCDYGMIKSPTDYMKKQIYLNVVETALDIEDNADDINLSNTIEGAHKRLNMMLRRNLPEECEIDLLNRIKNLPKSDGKTKKLEFSVFTYTRHPEVLKMVKDFSYPPSKDAAYDNPFMPPHMVVNRGMISVQKLCTYLDKFGTINKGVFDRVEKGLDKGLYNMKSYESLLKYKNPEIDTMLAIHKNTPKPILKKMLSENDSIITHTLIALNMAMQKEKLNDIQRRQVINLFNDSQKYTSIISEKDGNTSKYTGPRPQNRIELEMYIRVFENIGEQKDYPKECAQTAINTLKLYYDIKQKNEKFDPKENTTYKLQSMKNHILSNLEKNMDEMWVYKNIDKIKDIIDKIDDELKNREIDIKKEKEEIEL